MTEADICQVAEIEDESFPTTWPRTAYRRELNNRLARYSVLIDRAHAPTGLFEATQRRHFFGFFRRKPPRERNQRLHRGIRRRLAHGRQAHIVAIAVREAYRRQGLGELLIADAIDLALSNGQESVTLEVRRTNDSRSGALREVPVPQGGRPPPLLLRQPGGRHDYDHASDQHRII